MIVARFFITCVLLSILNQAFGALPEIKTEAVQFYRHQTSEFPSGQSNLATLRNAAIRSENRLEYIVNWNKSSYRVKAQNLVRDIELAKLASLDSGTKLYSQKNEYAVPLRLTDKKTLAEILQINESWSQIKLPEGLIAYVKTDSLKQHYEDHGYLLTMIPTFIRKSASMESPSIGQIAKGQKLSALSFEKNFAKVSYAEVTGYVSLDHLVSRADFATWVFSAQYAWSEVKFKQQSDFILKNGQKISLNDTQALVTKPQWAIVVTSEESGPLLRSRVSIEKTEFNQWTLSRLKGHGEVWWKIPRLQQKLTIAKKDLKLLTSDLLKQDIYSIAFKEKNSLQGLVSSEGIYRSRDGESWEKINLFQNKNHPVAIHPEGPWLVGAYISYDQGDNFEPFIRWDTLTETIEKKTGRAPKILKITKIETLKDYRILVHFDLGYSQISLRSKIGKWDWN